MPKPASKTLSLLDAYLDDDTPPLAPSANFVDRVGGPPVPAGTFTERVRPELAGGEKGKARDLLAAIRTLHRVEARGTPATPDERDALARFGGFGPVALGIFPNPATGGYRDEAWRALGDELKTLLAADEYASAKRTTFNAFYTAPVVIDAMHAALTRLGVPDDALVLEPGCGVGNFMLPGKRYLGVELDGTSGRIARALYPDADVRVEDFADTHLPELDAVIGNVPFADLKREHRGQKFALHDYFFAKSVDALKPGGVLALVTSHFTLDKQNAAAREYLAGRADFLGAIRLPSDAFKREGTAVVADIVVLRKRGPGEPANHADPDWLGTGPTDVDGTPLPINNYFLRRPEMVLGTYSGKDTLYGSGYSVVSTGDLAEQLREAVDRLPRFEPLQSVAQHPNPPPAFVPLPPDAHISEGSFFVRDGRVHQVVGGAAEPVVYGGGELWAGGGRVGRRVAHLIELRDLARRVLRSQNEGRPDAERGRARADLDRAYDRFRAAYGPINKTTLSASADGTAVRRMPNLVKFREDPDAMLVMALEVYDEATGEAEKAPILLRDVVGPTPPVRRVETAEEGLLVGLDRTGRVDLPLAAALYGKDEAAVIAELGDLIYHDPEAGGWVTADEYLSGDVRAKLAAAERAGVERNVAALRAVQPEDVLPGEIDANLGAPWLPAEDVRAFAAHLLRVPPAAITVAHLPKDATWAVEGDWAAERSVANTADYGTARASGLHLLDLALNLKTPAVYDPVPGDPDKRQVNPEETLKAKEKQRQIKEAFKGWVFADPDRAERLVRRYNDAFNCLRPRRFDGSHLAFPGMSRAVALRPHQRDVVWRGVAGGNTLISHVVGAGKTYSAAATAMKLRQTGLVKKPLVAVPNHLLEQFAREFQHLYPNAKLLVASKDDFARDRRKLLTAKVASGDWDAVIVTHSGFERVGVSRDFRERFLREQIAEYDALLADRAKESYSKARRNIVKAIEKQKAAREAKLKDLLAAEKKDDGLVFDELGVDQVIVDEFQAYKNLDAATKMDRVAGVQTGGSERAFDLYLKARYLHAKRPGRGLIGLSGTPVSNSLVEMYTLQRFFDPDGLAARGIEHFDAWAAAFGEVVEATELSPDGKTLKPRARFSKFVNLPELQQMFRRFADVQTADTLDLPRPALDGGKPHVVACPMSDAQRALQEALVGRYERVRNGGVDPREDNALAITTDGRKLALDARMLAPDAPDFPGSKLNALVGTVHATWGRTAAVRAAQLVFCDLGVNPTPWGFSAYGQVVAELVARGVPAGEVAVVGDADSDAQKQALFERVRQGRVRVLIGSTAKMGTGTNVQKRLAALHHLDAPWKPAEVEQRDGRILRQGNTHAAVAIYRYVTEGSFDAYMWQALETKARFIGQIMTGAAGARRAEDVGGQELSYAEVKAIASGNPAVLTLAEAEAELQRLAVLRRSHLDEQYLARKNLRELPATIARCEGRLAALEADARTVAGGDPGALVVGGRGVSHKDAAAALNAALGRVPDRVDRPRSFPLGRYRGLTFGVVRHPGGATDAYLEGAAVRSALLSHDAAGGRAVLNALVRLADGYGESCAEVRRQRAVAQTQLGDYEARLGRPFAHAAYLDELAGLRDRLKDALSDAPAEGEPTAAELAGRIGELRAAHAAAPARGTTSGPEVGAAQALSEAEDARGETPPKAEDPPPTDDDGKPAVPFRTRVRPTGTQGRLF